MKLMIDGIWRGDVDPTAEIDARRMIHAGSFRGHVKAAEAGRYHLYVSAACPFSHRVMIVRALKRLESVVGLSNAHPLWDTPDGWVFADKGTGTLDRAGNDFVRLHDAYKASSPNYTGKVTVPILWDGHTRQIVNNESLEIAQMLNDAFDGAARDCCIDLSPPNLKSAVEYLNARIERSLAVGVYAVADARHQQEYDRAMDDLFGFLDELDLKLSDGRRFVLGDQPTLADVLIYTPLVRFDAVYNPLFRASRKRLIDYACLPALIKRIHNLPGVAETLRYDHIIPHYYDGDWAVATRRGIVPELPAVNWLQPA